MSRGIALLWLLAGCVGSPQDTAACDTGLPVTWDGWADGFFATYCTSCHGAETEDRWGAPEGIDFDTEADVARWSEQIHSTVLLDQTMPPAGGIYDDDLVLLEAYLRCGIAE